MATLTEISITSRKSFLWLVGIFIGYLLLSTIYNLVMQRIIANRPVIIPPPNVRFGKIPSIQFPSSPNPSGLMFELQNIEGRVPESTNAAIVYKMPKVQPNILTNQKAKEFAQKLGFTKEPEVISPLYHRFTDPDDETRTLELDTVNVHFIYKYDFQKKPSLLANSSISNKTQAQNEVKSFIQQYGLFDDNILNGRIKDDLLTVDTDTLAISKANSISSSNLVRVNFFRNDIRGWQVLPPNFRQSPTYALYTPSSERKYSILELVYNYWPIAFDDWATYPLISGETAWNNLKEGNVYIANMGNQQKDKPVIIREIYLAYYDGIEPQSYLQPIFVFEGDNDFAAYLPAISAEWLE